MKILLKYRRQLEYVTPSTIFSRDTENKEYEAITRAEERPQRCKTLVTLAEDDHPHWTPHSHL